MILSEYLHQQAAAAGASHAFGVPGYFVMPIWHAFRKEPDVVLARHESGAAFMADGFARATGRLGVVLATTGPGMTNCVTGIACAYRDSVPMLVVTGQAPTATFGRGAFLESYVLDRAVSPAALLAPITKRSLEIVDPSNAAFLIDSAIALALSGRKGPVHLSIPVDLQQQDIPIPESRPRDGLTGRSLPTTRAASAQIAEAAGILQEAQRPMILAGWGSMLANAQANLARLAEVLGAPIVTSTKAASCAGANHPMFLGHLGPGQRSDIVGAVSTYDPDVVLVVGASLSIFYAGPLAAVLARATVIRIDIDPDQIHLRGRVDIGIASDAREAIDGIASILTVEDQDADRAGSIANLVTEFQDRAKRAIARQPDTALGMPSMAGTIARLSAMLPPDAVVLPDAGNHWLDTIALHRPGLAGGLHLNSGIGAMGWAIGASVGMAIAASDQQRQPLTVLITGDGSMLMHGAELSVAAEHDLTLLVVVFNNRSHGRVRLGQRVDFDSDPIGTDVPDIDFSQWMRVMGLRAFRVERADQVEPTFAEALATPGTVGIEVLCHPDEVPASLRNWIEDEG